jgi:ribosomal protein S18 acetylase RimI-like enzyme
VRIRRINTDDREWIREILTSQWGSTLIVARGRKYQADKLPGFIALLDDKRVGLITYEISHFQCHIVSLNSLVPRRGVGSALIEEVIKEAKEAACRRLWLVTTNDNTEALHFYQKRGFELVALYRNAMQKARKIKPIIPESGRSGIPIRDEIELEYKLVG